MQLVNPIYPTGLYTLDGSLFDIIVIPIGAWNMDTTAQKLVYFSPYSLDLEDILFVNIIITNDLQSLAYTVPYYNSATGNIALWVAATSTDHMTLERLAGDAFIGPSYDSVAISRGNATVGILR